MNQKGFTLIEVMVAMLIYGLALGAMAPVFVAHTQYNTRAELRTGALNAAQQVLDVYRVEDPTTLPTSGNATPEDVVIENRTYTVTTYFCQTADYCASGNNRHLTVDVAYQNEVIYSVETVFTRLQ